MIHSMTGFGKQILQRPGKKITVEIKSLNSKNLDVNARVPQAYREKELAFRDRIARALVRGKVDFSLYVESNGASANSEINQAVVGAYMEQLAELAHGEQVQFLEMALRLPDALKTAREEIDPEEFQAIEGALDQAIEQLQHFRLEEGRALEQDFRNRIKTLMEQLEEVGRQDARRIEAVRERLERAVAELKESVDSNRFEQELIYYLEKYDITEEKVRLAKHLEYFGESLDSEDSNGKKLGFISQEIGREINTIGSKANDASMQRIVVQMKDELEKIKEQMLNVL
ncbi:TIGR00255 family protein [Robiginitalea myxolifaciens]|uniref:TIGR00255 family protein n=1 Tax=Robiginitalea myxolifaciens TaxID=400055 RepID=A0A1I6FZ84_9FLAO|nr:YicC/YloC family endoribonuclease [Robiginitalea myxolifaciens]SFR35242.1 TIGR00255 family protein [Robiginitalea myxolifaciens]